MIFKFEAACGSFLGNGRTHNEDNFCFNKKRLPMFNKGMKNPLKCKGTTDDPLFFAVFDGMGGEKKGEEASYKAGSIFSEEFKKLDEFAVSGKEFLYVSCEKANKELTGLAKADRVNTIGTTVAALYFSQDEVVSCNLGDSKVFRVRNNQMVQISEDHTDEKIMSAIGVKKKPVLLQFLGISDVEMSIEPFIAKGDIQQKDTYIICSDGVTDVMDAMKIYEIVGKHNAVEAVRQILAEVDKADGHDNATVIVVKFE